MILQALTRYYEDLLSRGEIAAPGWAPAKISLALYINENGELTQIVPTMVEGTKGKKTVMQPQLMVLPAAVKRTVSIASNFLWDNSAYLLGIDQKGKPERSRECFAAAAKLHHAVLDSVDSPNARAILAFFDTWEPERTAEHPALIRQLDDVTAGGKPRLSRGWPQGRGGCRYPRGMAAVSGRRRERRQDAVSRDRKRG